MPKFNNYFKFSLIKKIKASLKGLTVVQRGCGLPLDSCDKTISACKAAGGSHCECFQCSTDLCNDSKSIHDSKLKTIGLVLLTVVFSLFYY